MTDEEYEPLCRFKESIGSILELDVPQPGPLAELLLFSNNLPAEFARLRAFLLA